MKKIIAHILVVLLIFGSIGDLSLVRASSGFDLLDEELFVEKSKDDWNHKLVKYSQGTGTYTFEYFIEDIGQKDSSGEYINQKPWKITLAFNNTSDEVTDVEISAQTSQKSNQAKTFLVRKLTNGKWGDQKDYNNLPEEEKGKQKMGEVVEEDGILKFSKELNTSRKTNSLGFNDTQIYLELSDIKVVSSEWEKAENLIIKVKKEGDQISFSTNGIKKGLVTCFRLQVGSGQFVNEYVFPGVDGLSVEPQHFVGDSNGGITSEEVLPLEEEKKESEENKEDQKNKKGNMNPGERPGVLIRYNKIKAIQINEDGTTFSVQKDAYTYRTKLRLDNSTMILDYNSKSPKISYSGKQGVVGAANEALDIIDEQINIRLASAQVIKDLENDGIKDSAKKIIPWKGLSYSQLLQDLEIATTIEELNKTFTEKDQSIPKYTYLKYELGQTVDEKVYIRLTPYKTTSNVEYYIFVDEKNKLDKDNLSFDKSSTATNKSKYQKKVIADKSGEEMKIEIAAEDTKCIRIVAVIDKVKKYYSQIMEIDTNNLVQEPEIPANLKISNVVVTPPKDNNTMNIPSAVKVDLSWNAPSNLVGSYLSKGELYYELILRDTASSEEAKDTPGTSSKAAYSKIYKVSKDGQTLESIGSNDEVGINQSGIFTVQDVYLKKESSEKNWEQLVTDDENISQAGKDAETHWEKPNLDFYSKVKQVSTLEDKETGKVYYLSLRAVYVPESKEGLLASIESSLVPLPIDFTKVPIPVVDSLEYDETAQIFNDKGNITGEIGFDHIDIRKYYALMLKPAGLYLNKNNNEKYSGIYEIYLYKKGITFNENNITDIIGPAQNKVDIGGYKEELEKGSVKWDYSIDELLGKKDKNELDEKIQIDNLEANQAYMIKVRVKLKLFDKAGNDIGERVSEFSREFSFTTTTQGHSPETGERIPPTPGEIKIEPVDGSNSAVKVIWDKANFVKDNDTEVYYELIRSTKDIRKELTKEELKKTVEEIVKDQNRMVGFATINVNSALNQKANYMIYQNNKWAQVTPVQEVPNYTYDQIILQDDIEKYSFVDDKLAPNNTYYYYVRTVSVIKDGIVHSTVASYSNKVKSEWISANITTSAIKPPRNLKVERDTKYNDDAKYNVVISFEAEVPMEANIPNDFNFEIGVATDTSSEDDYSNVKLLYKEKTDSIGWTKFVYKIAGLESNTRYNIKVRVVDKTVKIEDVEGLEENDVYAKSFYSDSIIARTDYDEEDEMDKQNYEEYLKRWEIEINKIKSRPYWKLDDIGTYKYRTEYVFSDFTYTNSYSLIYEEQTNEVEYYLPAEMIQYANENNTMLQIQLQNLKISVRPNTLLEDQEDIKETLKSIQNGVIQDYYVVIRSAQTGVDLKINGEKNISPKIQFNISLEHMKQKDKEIEVSILKVLDQIVEEERNNFIEKLKKELQGKKPDIEYLDELIRDSRDEVENKLGKDISKIIDKGSKKTREVETINQPVLISYQTNGVTANAYYSQNGWVKVPCLSNGKETLLEIKTWGWYIITGMQGLIQTVPTLAPYEAFINQYGLAEVFPLDAYMIQTAATKQQMYSGLAKVLGASSNIEYYTYLKNKGIKGLSKVNLSASIRQDEAIYIVMQGYEQLQRRSIQSISIPNKQSVQNIGAFQSAYRDYVYGAVVLKVIATQNNKVYPSSQITVETAINMLYGIHK